MRPRDETLRCRRLDGPGPGFLLPAVDLLTPTQTQSSLLLPEMPVLADTSLALSQAAFRCARQQTVQRLSR